MPAAYGAGTGPEVAATSPAHEVGSFLGGDPWFGHANHIKYILVGGLEHEFYFPYIRNTHPN